MWNWIDSLSYGVLVPIALLLGLAPFQPRPHLFEKIEMLSRGTLTRPIDIFDLVLHAAPVVILLLKVLRDVLTRSPG
jgi:hypothetical protein